MKSSWLLFTLPLLLSGQPALADNEEQRLARIEGKLEDLTLQHFQESVSVSGDDLDTLVTITTQDGFRHRGGFSDRYRTCPSSEHLAQMAA